MENVGILGAHFVYFIANWYSLRPFWYILWSFCVYFSVLVCCTEKNLATLLDGAIRFSGVWDPLMDGCAALSSSPDQRSVIPTVLACVLERERERESCACWSTSST
jgi:hypothetical protein